MDPVVDREDSESFLERKGRGVVVSFSSAIQPVTSRWKKQARNQKKKTPIESLGYQITKRGT